MAIPDDEHDDFEETETKESLRRKLGDQYADEIVRCVLDAEKRAVIRRESLVEMLDTGILEATEYADKVNLVARALLRDVAASVGPELCRKIYGIGPEEIPVLVDPRLMGRSPMVLTSQILAEIVVSELQIGVWCQCKTRSLSILGCCPKKCLPETAKWKVYA
jgi:hypothetical protein